MPLTSTTTCPIVLTTLLPPGQFPYPFRHDEAKWGVYQAANSILPWVNPKIAKIVIGQFTERGTGNPVVATQPISHKFDGNWMWTDKKGRIQPREAPLA